MPEIHLPKLDDESPQSAASAKRVHSGPSKSAFKFALEILMISIGVFLGLAGEQWRETRHNRELAHMSLRRLRTEIDANRKAVTDVREYHAQLLRSLRSYLAKDHKNRNTAEVQIQGLRFIPFEQTAWDLALTTQSLTYIDQDLAFALSRVYNQQKQFGELTRGMTQAMYLLPIQDNFDAFAQAANNYYGDAAYIEPKLLTDYQDLLQQIDRALAD